MTNPKTIDLAWNGINALPEGENWAAVERVFLEGNHFTTLPKTIGEWQNLQEIHLDNNRLTALPETIGRLSQLKT